MQHSFDAKRDCRLKLTHRRLFFATLPFLSLGCIRRTRGQIGTLMRHFREEVQRAQRGSDRGTKLVRTLPHKALRFGPNRHERASVNCLKRRHSSQLGPNFEHSLGRPALFHAKIMCTHFTAAAAAGHDMRQKVGRGQCCAAQRSLLLGPSLANEKCLISWKEIAQPKLQRRGPVINEPSFRKEVSLHLQVNCTGWHAFWLWVAYFQQFNAHTDAFKCI